jgi:hypothetical protein
MICRCHNGGKGDAFLWAFITGLSTPCREPKWWYFSSSISTLRRKIHVRVSIQFKFNSVQFYSCSTISTTGKVTSQIQSCTSHCAVIKYKQIPRTTRRTPYRRRKHRYTQKTSTKQPSSTTVHWKVLEWLYNTRPLNKGSAHGLSYLIGWFVSYFFDNVCVKKSTCIWYTWNASTQHQSLAVLSKPGSSKHRDRSSRLQTVER